jgi:ribosomal protein L20
MVENNRLMQFDFRQRQSKTEQMHHIVQRINKALEMNQYCSAAFQDISQS